MSITNLAFPCISYNNALKLDSLQATTISNDSSLDQNSLVVESTSQDEFKATSKQLSSKQPLTFIENKTFYEDELSYPLLIKIPSNLDKLGLSLSLNYTQMELIDLKSKILDQTTVFNELILVKVKKETELSVIKENLINDKKSKGIEDRVKSMGEINIYNTENIPTQSLLHEKSKRNYAFPTTESPIIISTSFNLKSTDYGKLTFYVFNRSEENKLEKLLKFSIWKDQKLNALTTTSAGNTTIIEASNEILGNFPLNDGPEFRQLVSHFEERIPQLKQLVSQTISTGKNLENLLVSTLDAKLQFTNSIKRLVEGDNDTLIRSLISKTVEPILKKSAYDDEQMLNNLKINILAPLNSIPANNNINALNSNKKIFEEESRKFYAWLNKYLSSGKSKDDKFLVKKKLFELSKFDYLSYLNDISNNASSNLELVNYLMTFINNVDKTQNLRLPQSSKELQRKLDKNDSERKLLRRKIDNAKTDEELEDILLNTTITTTNNDTNNNNNNGKNLYKAGILYTFGGQNKQGWHKQWIVLNNSSLIEYADWRKGKDKRGSLVDISLCSVKPVVSDSKRKNCFEIITSKGIRNTYQALTETERDSWMKLLYDAGQIIKFSGSKDKNGYDKRDKSALNDVESHRRRLSSVSLKNLNLVQNIDQSNLTCCDCNSTEGVEWISINLLTIFCIKCSSAHRNLGTSITKVKSLKLDNFTTEQISLISQINNLKSNSYWESDLKGTSKINSQSPDQERLQFIAAKYKDKFFLKKNLHEITPNNIMLHGIKDRNFNEMLWSIALGANINMSLERKNEEFSLLEYSLSKPLKHDIEIFDIAEFLILNGVKLSSDLKAREMLSEAALKYLNFKIDRILPSKS